MEELAAMDKEIHDLNEAIASAKSGEKLLRANLVAANATQSVEDVKSAIITLESERKEVLDRLGPLRSGNVKAISAKEKEEVEKSLHEWSRKAAARKKICMDLWGFCTEEMQEWQTEEELWVQAFSPRLRFWCS